MKKDIAQILLVALGLVGFAGLVMSAPPAGSNPGNYADVTGLINFSNTPQSKNCGGTGLANTTFSVCHTDETQMTGANKYALATDSLLSLGPVVAEGKLIADLSSYTGADGSFARDAIRLVTGKENNITSIFTNKELLGVWSEYLNGWAQGRFGRLDAEKVILTEMADFSAYAFGPVKTPANDLRTASYTGPFPATSSSSAFDGGLTNIDVAGTTNLGQGNYCYRKYKDCSGGANSPGGGNMYISRIGGNYVACRDIDPAEFPQATDMTDPGYFSCAGNRTAPAVHSGTMQYFPSFGYTFQDPPYGNGNTFCTGYANAVSQNPSDTINIYMSDEDDFGFGTYVFKDPYLERPLDDGWHAGGISPLADEVDPNVPGGFGVSWFKTARGSIIEIGKCFGNGAPGGNTMSPYPNAPQFWYYNTY